MKQLSVTTDRGRLIPSDYRHGFHQGSQFRPSTCQAGDSDTSKGPDQGAGNPMVQLFVLPFEGHAEF